MFQHWESFYLLIGGASGALIGLLFIVATLTKNVERDQALAGSAVYMAPVVGHLALILALSALATAPTLDPRLAAVAVAAAALVGLFWGLRSAWMLRTDSQFRNVHWSDFWWYGVWPALVYAALLAAAALASMSPLQASRAVAVVLVMLMMLAIRNAWDLVTWISATHGNSKAGQSGTSEEH